MYRICTHIYRYACIPIYLHTYVTIYLYTYMPIYLVTYLPTYLDMFAYICSEPEASPGDVFEAYTKVEGAEEVEARMHTEDWVY